MNTFTIASTVVAIVLYQVALAADGSTDWSYDDQLSWPGVCVDGKSQSPISIQTAAIDQSVIINDITINHDVAHNVSIVISGHGMGGIVDSDKYGFNITNVRGYEDDHFVLHHVHPHWGLSNYTGSEHLIEGKAYPLEMHFVHYNDKFNSLGEAKGQPGGLAVIGVLFEIGEANSEIAKFLDSILAGRSTVDSVDLTALMPVDASTMFYAYNGSLTTPTCDENLLWHVAKTTMTVSEDQLEVLRGAVGPSGELIAPNYREAQPLNDRKIYVTEGMKDDVNGYCSSLCDSIPSCNDSKYGSYCKSNGVCYGIYHSDDSYCFQPTQYDTCDDSILEPVECSYQPDDHFTI
ncbi:hypothetical protein FOL47_007846 [Perkinsus chesapeaki]|uniref:Carbonic anhydrase n=1 Tax=Perkinsus chesapeaki TaxID=330153 RepID=A0A7J6MUV1_PERCH|nr:hypothetical protein FOL47_007846 [Perkinsus chesapeaki]